MSDTILLLRLEHESMSILFDLIASMAEKIEEIGDADLNLLRNALDYLMEYPDQCHHPIENLIYKRLSLKTPPTSESIGRILADHQNLRNLTRHCSDLLAAVQSGEERVENLASPLRELVRSNRSHMSMEETHFFPVALANLASSDWEQIEYQLFDQKDPLYDHEAEERYAEVREKLSQYDSQRWHRTTVLRNISQIKSLQTCHDFNQQMQRLGESIRLQENANGSYSVVLEDSAAIDIPACDELRAVWCAAYFLRGLHHRQDSDQNRTWGDLQRGVRPRI